MSAKLIEQRTVPRLLDQILADLKSLSSILDQEELEESKQVHFKDKARTAVRQSVENIRRDVKSAKRYSRRKRKR